MNKPTQADWNRLKEQRKAAREKRKQPLSDFPDDLFLADDDDGVIPVPRPDRSGERRKFRQYDEAWAGKIEAAGRAVKAATHRLVTVLLAEADFKRRIPIGKEIELRACLARDEKRGALEQLEKLGLIAVEWRGRGRLPIAIPLRLKRRPGRK